MHGADSSVPIHSATIAPQLRQGVEGEFRTFKKDVTNAEGKQYTITVYYPKDSKVTPEKAAKDIENKIEKLVLLADSLGLGKDGLKKIQVTNTEVFGHWDKGSRSFSDNFVTKLNADKDKLLNDREPSALEGSEAKKLNKINTKLAVINNTIIAFKSTYPIVEKQPPPLNFSLNMEPFLHIESLHEEPVDQEKSIKFNQTVTNLTEEISSFSKNEKEYLKDYLKIITDGHAELEKIQIGVDGTSFENIGEKVTNIKSNVADKIQSLAQRNTDLDVSEANMTSMLNKLHETSDHSNGSKESIKSLTNLQGEVLNANKAVHTDLKMLIENLNNKIEIMKEGRSSEERVEILTFDQVQMKSNDIMGQLSEEEIPETTTLEEPPKATTLEEPTETTSKATTPEVPPDETTTPEEPTETTNLEETPEITTPSSVSNKEQFNSIYKEALKEANQYKAVSLLSFLVYMEEMSELHDYLPDLESVKSIKEAQNYTNSKINENLKVTREQFSTLNVSINKQKETLNEILNNPEIDEETKAEMGLKLDELDKIQNESASSEDQSAINKYVEVVDLTAALMIQKLQLEQKGEDSTAITNELSKLPDYKAKFPEINPLYKKLTDSYNEAKSQS